MINSPVPEKKGPRFVENQKMFINNLPGDR